MKIAALAFGAVTIIGGYALFANNSKTYNSVLQNNSTAFVKTAYTETGSTPIDFEKAASSAVPTVVHIKTVTKFKETAGRNQQQRLGVDDQPVHREHVVHPRVSFTSASRPAHARSAG